MAELRKKMANFLATDIYGITEDRHSRGRGHVEIARLLVEAGVKVVQYREKDKSVKAMYEDCLAIREITAKCDVTFIVNDRPDIAIAVNADGVHVGQDDMPPDVVRKLVGPDMIIGLSTHSPEQANKALAMHGVIDYIGVGPLFATNTKVDVMDPVGLEYLDYVVKNVPIPFVAIGGIKEHNAASVRSHGGKIMCLVTELTMAEDVSKKVEGIRATIESAKFDAAKK